MNKNIFIEILKNLKNSKTCKKYKNVQSKQNSLIDA